MHYFETAPNLAATIGNAIAMSGGMTTLRRDCKETLIKDTSKSFKTKLTKITELHQMSESQWNESTAGGNVDVVLDGLPLGASYDEMKKTVNDFFSKSLIKYSEEESETILLDKMDPNSIEAYKICMTHGEGATTAPAVMMWPDRMDARIVSVSGKINISNAAADQIKSLVITYTTTEKSDTGQETEKVLKTQNMAPANGVIFRSYVRRSPKMPVVAEVKLTFHNGLEASEIVFFPRFYEVRFVREVVNRSSKGLLELYFAGQAGHLQTTHDFTVQFTPGWTVDPKSIGMMINTDEYHFLDGYEGHYLQNVTVGPGLITATGVVKNRDHTGCVLTAYLVWTEVQTVIEVIPDDEL